MRREGWPRTNYCDLTGRRFGRLTVLSDSGLRSAGGHVYWWCECDCGRRVRVMGHNLRTGNTVSCGCYFLERCAEFGRKGGSP